MGQIRKKEIRIIDFEDEKEARLQDFLETRKNPFDTGKSILGLDNKKPKHRYQKQRQKQLDRIEKHLDIRVCPLIPNYLDLQLIGQIYKLRIPFVDHKSCHGKVFSFLVQYDEQYNISSFT